MVYFHTRFWASVGPESEVTAGEDRRPGSVPIEVLVRRNSVTSDPSSGDDAERARAIAAAEERATTAELHLSGTNDP
jgi:hypothetical protein